MIFSMVPICLSVGHTGEVSSAQMTNRDAAWGVVSGGPKNNVLDGGHTTPQEEAHLRDILRHAWYAHQSITQQRAACRDAEL